MRFGDRIRKLERQIKPIAHGGIVIRLRDGSGFLYRKKVYRRWEDLPDPRPFGYALFPEQFETPEEWEVWVQEYIKEFELQRHHGVPTNADEAATE